MFSFLSLLLLSSGIAWTQAALTGDSKCFSNMCISAIVNGSIVEYFLQSTGGTLGWMGMGFGVQMTGTQMVVMWPNADGSVTLSQRKATGESLPPVDSNPARIATFSQALSTSTTAAQPKFVFTMPANGDTTENIIWAYGTTRPSSSSPSATFTQHTAFGSSSLNLAASLSSNGSSSTTSSTASSTSSGQNGTTSSVPIEVGSSKLPLVPYQRMIVAHAICCTLGFLLFLPTGALLARYMRTFTPAWYTGHWIAQFLLAGPMIIVGVILGIAAVANAGAIHLDDVHKRWGVGLLALYFGQCALGAFIHWCKPKNSRRRPAQNYAHGVTGILIIGLAFYQVRTGFATEWPNATGRGHVSDSIYVLWDVWVLLMPILYSGGLMLLPRQFAQERAKRRSKVVNNYKLEGTEMSNWGRA